MLLGIHDNNCVRFTTVAELEQHRAQLPRSLRKDEGVHFEYARVRRVVLGERPFQLVVERQLKG